MKEEIMKLDNSNLYQILGDYGEVIIDDILLSDNNPLKELPVVSTAVSLIKFGKKVINYSFEKKLYYFIYNLDNISKDKKQKFYEKFTKQKINEIVEKIINIIDKTYEPKKSILLAKAYKLLIEDHINLEEFERLVDIIHNSQINILNKMKDYHYGEDQFGNMTDTDIENLYRIGLLDNIIPDKINYFFGKDESIPMSKRAQYEINKYGDMVIGFGLIYED